MNEGSKYFGARPAVSVVHRAMACALAVVMHYVTTGKPRAKHVTAVEH